MIVSAVTFDVWETLIHDTMGYGRSRSQLRATRMAEVLRHHGHPVDSATARHLFVQAHDILQREIWPTYLDVGTRVQLGIFLSFLDPRLDSAADESLMNELDVAYTSPFFDHPPALAPGADWALRQIRQSGIRLGLVCNTGITPGRDIRKLLEIYGVLGFFEELVFSDEEGIRKPRPEIFERILLRLGISPSEAIHVGDDATNDVGGAKGAGMKTIMVRRCAIEDLPVLPDLRVDDLHGVPEAIENLKCLDCP
ncbi:MAG: HAD family hydrolase [Dehalococcoidia bacterium]|nr:HAD family hydrolase [Dehalococcoidia bacterium]